MHNPDLREEIEGLYDYLQGVMRHNGMALPSKNYDWPSTSCHQKTAGYSGIITTLATKLDACFGWKYMTRPT
jgi:hypothetical protein